MGRLKAVRGWFAIAGGAIVLHGCASTPDLSAGNPLPGIGLEASGPAVFLSWDADGPLGQQLRPNTNLQLVASYDTDNGAVRGEPVANARVGGIYSAIKFDLPDSLNNVATGPVCFQMVQNRRAIPVRIARPGESSDGFYYNEWVSVANSGRALNVLKRDKVNIDQNVANFAGGDPDFVNWQTREGLTSRADCETLTPNFSEMSSVRPDTALQGAQSDRASRQQCVALLDRFPDQRFFIDTPALSRLRPGLTGLQLAREMRANVPSTHRLAPVAEQLVTDFQTLGPGRDYFEVAQLPINRATLEGFLSVNKGVVTEANAISLTEAYSGCLSETQARFDQSYQAWQASRDPALRQDLTQARRAECRTRFDSFQQREDRLAYWLEQQAENQAEIDAIESASLVSLPDRKPLIPEACPFS
ncbi:MAG: hypothetical protein AAF767_02680 [Pseudomonadota bacterium]